MFSDSFNDPIFEIEALGRSGLGLAHGAHFATRGAAAVEDADAVALESGHGHASRHLEALDDFASLRIDATQLALLESLASAT